MGHRLNIELTNDDQILCSCYWDEAAYTDTALDLTEAVIKTYDDVFGGSGADLFIAAKIFETMGGGIVGVERERIRKEFGGVLELAPARSVYDGIIAATEAGIRENRRWEQGRVRIDLSTKIFDFHVHYYTYMEDYIDFYSRVKDCKKWEKLPKVEANWDIFNGLYFDHVEMVRRLIERCPDGFRLSNGDVVEWI
jgi:hypothetical protein